MNHIRKYVEARGGLSVLSADEKNALMEVASPTISILANLIVSHIPKKHHKFFRERLAKTPASQWRELVGEIIVFLNNGRRGEQASANSELGKPVRPGSMYDRSRNQGELHY